MGRDEKLNPFARMNQPPRPTGVIDNRGHELREGDEVMIITQWPLFFRVIAIRPVLDPKAPPGTMRIEFGCAPSFMAPSGVAQGEFIRVRTAEEAGPNPFTRAGDATVTETGNIGKVELDDRPNEIGNDRKDDAPKVVIP